MSNDSFAEIQEEINRLMANIIDSQKAMKVSKIFVNEPQMATATDWCIYNGKRVRIISKNYQTGEAVLEDRDVTGPYTLTVKLGEVDIENPRASNKCTCGVDSVGGDKHSDYCDKYFSWRP